MKSRELRAEIDRWFDVHAAEMIEDLRSLISIKSVNGEPKDGMPYGEGPFKALSKAKEMLISRGFEIKDFDNRIFTADLSDKPPELGILVHVDVVPEGEGWDSDPYEAVIRDGKIYGRGASDDKGPAVAALYAMYCARDIAPDLKKGFRIIIGSAEEIGCEDIKYYLQIEKAPRWTFSPDADYPVINIEKGRFVPVFGAEWQEDLTLPRIVSISGGVTANVVPNKAEAEIEGLELSIVEEFCSEYAKKTGVKLSALNCGNIIKITAEGVAVHAMRPEKGRNAQTALLSMLAAMPVAESKGFDKVCALADLFPHGDTTGKAVGISMSDELSGALSLNFGVLKYTVTGFTANLDSRTPACATRENLLEVLQAALISRGIQIKEVSYMTHCHHTPADSPFVQTLLRIYEDYTGLKGETLAVGGTTYVHNIEGGVAFGCAMPGIDYRIHGANEFIGTEELILSAKMFTQAILDICS